jgi:hypothetical protein
MVDNTTNTIDMSSLALEKISFFDLKQKEYGSPMICRGKGVDADYGPLNYSNMIYDDLNASKVGHRYFSGLTIFFSQNFYNYQFLSQSFKLFVF